MASTPQTKYDKEKVEGHQLEIQRVLNILVTSSSHLDDNVTGDATYTTLGVSAKTSSANSGMFLVPLCSLLHGGSLVSGDRLPATVKTQPVRVWSDEPSPRTNSHHFSKQYFQMRMKETALSITSPGTMPKVLPMW
jgi:hypothetical protein